MKRAALTFLGLALASAVASGSTSAPRVADDKVVRAVRADGPMVIDGRLDESVWKTAPASTGFTQHAPDDGAPATEPTEVRVAFDDHALYVAALCRDSEPSKVRKRLGRRDAETDSDWFAVLLDPYFDRRSGYLFAANPAGAVTDAVLSNDVDQDDSWDGVWETRAVVDGEGWAIEFRIPFNQIRFPKKDEYVWGINFRRMIRRRNEESSFNWRPKDEAAFVSRFARLEGLRGIRPGRHIEFMPYAVAQAQFRPAEAGNPFETGKRWQGDAGFDLKAGLKGNLTLDATVNPDFGQVEVDPAVINLSDYETYYEEKRPFFIEGASLFSNFGRGGASLNIGAIWPQPRFFYSRRVGRSPQGSVTGDGFVRRPDRTTILGAAKLTGQMAGGWNVGFLSAVTAGEFAQIDRSGTRLSQRIEPLSAYGALRVQREIDEGRSGFGLMATGVARDLEDGASDTLAAILNRNAFSLAADGWLFLDKKKYWIVSGWAGGTRIEGSAEDIRRLQVSSMHYFQRPDATHVTLDPSATSLSGWGGRLNLAKQSGSLIFLANVGALSPGFDPNDAGFQPQGSDVINVQLWTGYRWTKPGRVLLFASILGGWCRNYDFGGNRTREGVVLELQAQLRNFWGGYVSAVYVPAAFNSVLTRGGPLARIPSGYQLDTAVWTDNRKPVVFEAFSMLYRRPGWGGDWSGHLSMRWKAGSNISLSIGPALGITKSGLEWVTRVADGFMSATYGTRYIFARADLKVLRSEVRLDWTFTPRLTLQAYLQPFIAVGAYDGFKELAAPRTSEYNEYGAAGGSTIAYDAASRAYAVDPDGPSGAAPPFAFRNPDFSYKSLRGTVVLRWEYRPGSLLYFVWTQNRADLANPGTLRLGRDLGDLFTAPGDNIFLLKASYRWNI